MLHGTDAGAGGTFRRTVTPAGSLDDGGGNAAVSRMHSLRQSSIVSGEAVTPSEAVPVRLVCDVSKDERRLFLPHAAERFVGLPLAVTWADKMEARPDGLLHHSADIVLTAWATRRALKGWLGAPACPVRYVCHLAGSVRHIVPRAFIERGGIVTNWSAVPAGAVAEHAVLLALGALRNLGAWPAAERHFSDTVRRIEGLDTRTLFGRRVGLHGFGRVAKALVPLLRPFGVRIAAFSDGVPESLMQEAGVTPCASLAALFRQSEILIECEGLTPATAGSVSADVLAVLPAGAVFVNVARGQIVDEVALLREQASGRLRVALDVVATEPVEQTRELFRRAGAVLSPHIAGPTLDQYPHCGELALENIARFVRGEALHGIVTLEEYDRAT